MPNPFYNTTERRLRALWRILLQFALFFVITGLFNYIVIALAALVGGIALDDPSFLNKAITYVQMRPPWRLFSLILEIASVFIWLWLSGKLLDRRSLVDFGFHLNRRWWIDFAFGCVLGAVLMAFIFLFERAAGWVEVTGTFEVNRGNLVPFWVVIGVSFLHYISVAISEESLFRGYQLRNAAEGLNLRFWSPRAALLVAFLLSSIIFGMAHLGNPNATFISTFNIALAGIFLGLGFVLTGELAIPIGLHLTWNFFQGNVFGFPVSGTSHGATLIAIEQLGPDIWTGGAFGPEAGIIGLVAIALGSLLTVLWVKWRYGAVRLEEALAVYQKGRGKETETRRMGDAETQREEEGILS